MAGSKSVILNILGNNSSAMHSIEETEAAQAGLKEETAATNETAAAGSGKWALMGLAVGAVAIKTIGLASSFQEAATQLVTGAGESEKNLKLVEDGMLKIGSATGTASADIEKGMFLIESAGYHGAAGLKVLDVAAKGAKATGADVADMANTVTSALNAYHLPASKAANVTSELISTVAHGKMTMTQLSTAIANVLPVAASAHVSLADVGGALATMTSQGTNARRATMNLRSVITNMISPNATAAKSMDAFGLSSDKLSKDLGQHGLAYTLNEVSKAVQHGTSTHAEYVQGMKSILGGVTGLGVALQLTGKHMTTFESNSKGIAKAGESGKTMADTWKKAAGDFAVQTDIAKQSVIDFATGIGLKMLPALTGMLHGAIAVFGYLQKYPQVGAIVVGVTAAFVGLWGAIKAGQVVMGMFTTIKTAVLAVKNSTLIASAATKIWAAAQWLLNLAMDANPIGLVIVGITLLIGVLILIGTHVKSVGHFFSTVWHGILDVVSAVWNWIKGHWPLLLGIITGPIGMAVEFVVTHWHMILTTLSNVLHGVVNWFNNLPSMILHALGDLASLLVDAGKNLIEGLWRGISDAASWLWGKVKGLASGISNIFKNILGIFSPSRVFSAHGRYIVEGLVKGLDDNAPRAYSAIGRLAHGVTGAMHAGRHAAAAGGRGGGGGVSVVNNFNRLVAGNADAIAKDIQTLLVDLKRHRGGRDLGLA